MGVWDLVVFFFARHEGTPHVRPVGRGAMAGVRTVQCLPYPDVWLCLTCVQHCHTATLAAVPTDHGMPSNPCVHPSAPMAAALSMHGVTASTPPSKRPSLIADTQG